MKYIVAALITTLLLISGYSYTLYLSNSKLNDQVTRLTDELDAANTGLKLLQTSIQSVENKYRELVQEESRLDEVVDKYRIIEVIDEKTVRNTVNVISSDINRMLTEAYNEIYSDGDTRPSD